MLWHKAIGAGGTGGGADILFVGSQTFNPELPGSITITNLTGGIATTPSAGDLIIVVVAPSEVIAVDETFSITTSGYTKVCDLYANYTYDAQLAVFYKRLTSAETVIGLDVDDEIEANVIVYVLRNTNSTSPLDVATQTVTGSPATPDSGAITTVTNNSLVIAVGCAAGGGTFGSATRLTILTVPSGMADFVRRGGNIIQIAIASILRETAGSYDPPTFGGGSTASGTSYCAATLAIRPA
jgi:hypothetical protein